MNDYKNNWFYKTCSKQGGKNIVFIVVGVLLVLTALFTSQRGICAHPQHMR